MLDHDADQILTASDAARILGISRDMVRVLARRGILRSRRAANGYHLFRRGDVEQLARERAEKRIAQDGAQKASK
jgi:DNA-binding transcriptional MerR regulator